MDRTSRIDELKMQRAAIDAELDTIKKAMKADLKAAFAIPKSPSKRRKKDALA